MMASLGQLVNFFFFSGGAIYRRMQVLLDKNHKELINR